MNKNTIKIVLVLIVQLSLFSCQKTVEDKLVGVWYHFDYYQTENTFYTENQWAKTKDSLLEQAKEPVAITIRPEYYIKLSLNKDFTFTEKTYDIASNTCIDNCNDTINISKWKVNGDTLFLQTKFNEQIIAEKVFKLTRKENEFKATFIKEIRSNTKRELEEIYNLSKKEANFKNLIQEIGIDKNASLLENWEMLNFGKYSILRDYNFVSEEDNIKYNKHDVLYSGIWEQVPYYDPIFEHSKGRLLLGENGKLTIVYQVLGSASGKCGTLENDDFDFGNWQLNLKEKQLTFIRGNQVEKVPFEVKKLFKTNALQGKYNYNILAKNKAIIILENPKK